GLDTAVPRARRGSLSPLAGRGLGWGGLSTSSDSRARPLIPTFPPQAGRRSRLRQAAISSPTRGQRGSPIVTSRAKSPAGLRPFLLSDAPLLAEIFRASIAELTTEDYSEAQQAAWMASAGDEAAFGARLAGELTLVATIDGAAVGFA